MKTLKARVIKGRLILDEPTTFPEGTELELTLCDGGDELSEEERLILHEKLQSAWSSAQAGHIHPVEDLIKKLGSPR